MSQFNTILQWFATIGGIILAVALILKYLAVWKVKKVQDDYQKGYDNFLKVFKESSGMSFEDYMNSDEKGRNEFEIRFKERTGFDLKEYVSCHFNDIQSKIRENNSWL